MTKKEMISSLSKKTGLTRKQTETAIDLFFDTIKEAVKRDGSFNFRKFGTFMLHTRAERKGRNPSTGELMTIPSKTFTKFKAAKEFLCD